MIQDVAAIATAVGVLVGALSLLGSWRTRVRQFEALYIQRYWELMNELSLVALSGDASHGVVASDEKTVRAYFRLCEDEIELKKKRWFSKRAWDVWEEGMIHQLRRWPFCEVWSKVKADTPGEFQWLRSLMDNQDASVSAAHP
jgi:hypothetical protein